MMKNPITRLCTKKQPWSKERDNPGDLWQHDNIIEVGDQINGWPGGDIQKYRCLNCGVAWKRELPQ